MKQTDGRKDGHDRIYYLPLNAVDNKQFLKTQFLP